MALRIEDYAIIGDTQTAALVGNDGSIDWLCLPRFDSDACFAALLGDERNGRWLLAPTAAVREIKRRYRPGTLVLETDFVTDDGTVRITDCMPPRSAEPDLVRMVTGLKGRVTMRMELTLRFGYGQIMPWARGNHERVLITAGPDAVALHSPVEAQVADGRVFANFTIAEGQSLPFLLDWHPSHEPAPPTIDMYTAVDDTDRWWQAWSAQCTYKGPFREDVLRSLITLKALTFSPTGGIVAAATTSLPEKMGGVRNWDYRYCWLRDATFTLYALMSAGYSEEALAWRNWLLRAVAGDPAQLQIMYGVAGERRLTETELPWLPGYAGSKPVRIGNGAVNQFQLDVYGEVMDALLQARRIGVPLDEAAWALERRLTDYVESCWREPDEGIWEVRGPRRDFTHSKVMAWVAVDRAIQSVELLGMKGPVDRWRALRAQIHAEVCERGYDASRNTFTQYYGSRELDAACLTIPLVGFLPPRDPRVIGTIEAIQRDLLRGGFVERYTTRENLDGLPPGEGVFLACSFWLVDALALMGRRKEAIALFERLLALKNDVGLLAEEYEPDLGCLVGNYPQAFSHIGLVNSALILSREDPHPLTD